MKNVFLPALLSIVLVGCGCDSICESHNQTVELLSSYSDDLEVVRFLNQYNGEGPGSEKFSVFVNWGVKNSQKVTVNGTLKLTHFIAKNGNVKLTHL